MCIYGNIAKIEIKEEKEKAIQEHEELPKKYIPEETALKKEKKEPGIFVFGLISHLLKRNNIETVIEEDDKTSEDFEGEAITSLQFLTNGLIAKKKYELSFNLPEERVQELLFIPEEYEEFKDNLRSKLSGDFNIPKEKIVVTFPQRGSFKVQVIFQSDDFNDLSEEDFKDRFKYDDKYPELSKLKTVHSTLLTPAFRLSKKQLDARGNRYDDWPLNQTRGGELYDAPTGWIGIGLKVFGTYLDDRWLDMYDQEGEWVVAYHGVGSGLTADEVAGIPSGIIGMKFLAGKRQAHKDCPDAFHEGEKVGEGVYVTPYIKVAEAYAGVSIINGKRYKTVIMSRVNPKARRHCIQCKESREYKYWVVSGDTDEIRPYRILYKRC